MSRSGVSQIICYAPDGSNSGYIERIPNGSFPLGRNIVAASGATRLVERHFWGVAIEAQKFLTDGLQRRVKCSVEL